MFYALIKRFLDIFLSAISIFILSPLFIIIGLFIKYDSKGDILYKGVRSGLKNQPFRILKFRTMVENAEQLGGFSTAVNDARFTRLGRVLRKYKLDELPQLFNVLFGEMSLVGPRPQVIYYTKKYRGAERSILSVKPGITDYASIYFSDMDKVLGKNNVDDKYEKEIEPLKNQLRIKYVNERSLLVDLRILVETFFLLFGISNITGLDIEV